MNKTLSTQFTADEIIKRGMSYFEKPTDANAPMVMLCYYPTRCMSEARGYPLAKQLNNTKAKGASK